MKLFIHNMNVGNEKKNFFTNVKNGFLKSQFKNRTKYEINKW